MKRSLVSGLAAVTAAFLIAPIAGADVPPLKIGLVSTLSGNFTEAGKTGDAAIAAF